MSIKKALLGLVGDKILHPARIQSVEVLSENFRLVELFSPVFAKTPWSPGEKIQLNIGDWNVRTYTPLSIDQDKKILRILVFLHGHGPGSIWGSQAKVGDTVQFLGPRSSLTITETPVLFGDETSIAVATTFQKQFPAARFVFEVSSVTECFGVCKRLGLTNFNLIEKSNDGSHLKEVFESLQGPEKLILTGSARSIQNLQTLSRQANISRVTKNKAYWATGKAGLD